MCTVTVPLAVIFSNILLLQTVRMWGLVTLSFLAKTRLRRSNEKCLENHIKSPEPPKMRPPKIFGFFDIGSCSSLLHRKAVSTSKTSLDWAQFPAKTVRGWKTLPSLGTEVYKQMMRQDFSVSSNLQSTKGTNFDLGGFDFPYPCGFSLKCTFIQAAYLASVESWIGEFWFSSSWLVHKAEEKPSLSVWLPTFITNFQPEEAEGATGAIAGVAPKAHIHADC